MKDITVRYLSKVNFPISLGFHTHTHDYWHFAVVIYDPIQSESGNTIFKPPMCFCYPEGALNLAQYSPYTSHDINVMFVVNNPSLARRLEMVPFGQLQESELHLPLLEQIMQQVHTLNPTQSFVDFAFGYYLLSVAEGYENSHKEKSSPTSLTEKAISFIEENYMKPITLEDIANHINRTVYHTSHLFKAATGTTVVEYLRSVRIKAACMKLAYSKTPIEEIITSCGFNDSSYFFRVFKNEIGTTPKRYRTSHQLRYTYYDGDEDLLDIPYKDPCYTYIPSARKCIDWKTPREYFSQVINEFE